MKKGFKIATVKKDQFFVHYKHQMDRHRSASWKIEAKDRIILLLFHDFTLRSAAKACSLVSKALVNTKSQGRNRFV